MIIRRTTFDPDGASSDRGHRARQDDAEDADFRGRAQRLLEEANAVEDVTARTELVIKAAILHHLALLREAGREIAPMSLSEPASFAKSRLDAHLLGQDGQKRGLRGGPETLGRAREAYDAGEPSPESRRGQATRRRI